MTNSRAERGSVIVRAATMVTAVAVSASAPLTKAGATSILSADSRLRVLPDDELGSADVLVVLEESVGSEVFAFLRAARSLSERETPPRCVIVSDQIQPEALMTAIECGLAAMLPLRSTDPGELVRMVLAVSQGEAHLPPRVQGALLSELDRIQRGVLEPNGLTLSGPSIREREVLRLLADGYGTEEIAGELMYSAATVKNVLHGLMTRYGLHSRAHAVAFALRAAVI